MYSANNNLLFSVYVYNRAYVYRLQASLEKGVDVSNLKRESKLYSYDDQKWEAELQQERLARQRAARGAENDNVLSLMKQAKLSDKRQVSVT